MSGISFGTFREDVTLLSQAAKNFQVAIAVLVALHISSRKVKITPDYPRDTVRNSPARSISTSSASSAGVRANSL